MSPEFIEQYRVLSKAAGEIVDNIMSRKDCGYSDPYKEDFSYGAAILGEAIELAIGILPDCSDSMRVLASLEGIRDHLMNLASWVNDNVPKENDTVSPETTNS